MKFYYPNTEILSRLQNFMGSADGFNEASIEAFEEKAERDFKTIESVLPENVNSVLDIGSGLGGVNILLYNSKHFIEEINIIDGDGTEDKQTSFHEGTKAWFDRKVGRDLIQANVGNGCVVRDYPPDPELTIPVDLIISLKSWGHHYPVGTYLGLAQRSLKSGGRIIIDIRKRRGDGVMVMQRGGFKRICQVYSTSKCDRTVFERE